MLAAIKLIQKRLTAVRNIKRYGDDRHWRATCTPILTEKECIAEINELEDALKILKDSLK